MENEEQACGHQQVVSEPLRDVPAEKAESLSLQSSTSCPGEVNLLLSSVPVSLASIFNNSLFQETKLDFAANSFIPCL